MCFSCDKPGHRVGRCPELDETFPGWSAEKVVVADLNFCNSVVGGPTSTPLKSAGLIVDLAEDVTVGVSSPADLAGSVTVGVLFPAYLAGGVGAAPSAVAEVVSSSNIAEVVHSAALAELASSADLAGDVTASVASSAISEVASSADITEVSSSADLDEVASSADLAEVESSADLTGDVTVGVASLADPVVLSPPVWRSGRIVGTVL